MGVRRRMWNWLRRRISIIFERVRIVEAAFFWYTLWQVKVMFSSMINREGFGMKNILVIQGGGRAKGNTAQLINSFKTGAEESGHSVEVISLLKNEVRGCLGCNACRYGKPCVQKDAFNDIVPKIKAADCIVFASPLYFWTVSSRIKAFIERFYCIAEEDPNPPLGRYEKYPVKDCALLMTSADDFFWTFEQAVSYYQFALVNYIGFKDRGMVLAGGCGDTNGRPQIDKTEHLQEAYEFGKCIYPA